MRDGDRRHLDEASSKRPRRSKGRDHEVRQVDAAQAAAAVGRQRLLAAGIGRLDGLAVAQVVVLVDAVEEQHARLGVVVGAERMIWSHSSRARTLR
jgi:hypothetical protein